MSEARINLPAKIFPTGNFETHEDTYGKGGFVVLNDSIGSSGADEFINERITYQRRKEGMLVYLSSNSNYYRCVVTGSSESEGQWTQQYFSGRYFHGASAPTADNLRVGEKWFNTTVGSEFTYLPTDEDQDTFFWVDIDHLGQGETGFVRISGDVMTGALTTPFVTMTQGFTSSSGFIGTLTGNSSSFTSLTASNGFIGTLTGNSSSFTSLTASNGFIGTLTGNNIRYTDAHFGSDSFIVQGSSATFTDMSVMITGDSSLKKHDLTIGTTFDAGNGQNPNVYRIFALDGVALGGNNLSKNNWFGNNVFLSPTSEHSVLLGFPLSYDTSDQEKLTVTGGIVSDRIFALGSGKGGLTGLGSKKINALSHALAAGITTVNGYETPLFSVQDRQPGGWVNAPKIRRVWPTGETGSTGRTDPNFEENEYVTKKYVYFRDVEANPNGQKWRFTHVGVSALAPDIIVNTNTPTTYEIDTYRDLGFTGQSYIDVVVQPYYSTYTMAAKTIRVSGNVSWSSFKIIFDNYGNALASIVDIDLPSKEVRITTSGQLPTGNGNSAGHHVYVNITPSS